MMRPIAITRVVLDDAVFGGEYTAVTADVAKLLKENTRRQLLDTVRGYWPELWRQRVGDDTGARLVKRQPSYVLAVMLAQF